MCLNSVALHLKNPLRILIDLEILIHLNHFYAIRLNLPFFDITKVVFSLNIPMLRFTVTINQKLIAKIMTYLPILMMSK